MKKKILIMGLPGSGKTYLANILKKEIKAIHYNADKIRKKYSDWDFSNEGRIRQAIRMKKLCEESIKKIKLLLRTLYAQQN